MNTQDISILIISFNCWDLLDKCIRSILASNISVKEIVVIDNFSLDGTPEKFRKTYPGLTFIENSKNIGHPRAVNQGFKIVTGEHILLLDSDTELSCDAIRNLSAFLGNHPDICMVAPRLLSSDGSIQESARNFPSAWNGLFSRQGVLTRIFPNNIFSRKYLLTDSHVKQTPFQVEHVSSAAIFFRKSLLDLVGPFDEAYKGYWVDADWCMRIQKSGEKIFAEPRAVISHHEQLNRYSKQSNSRIILFHKGVFRFYRLHYTYGYFDPRSLIAATLLFIRALVCFVINTTKKQYTEHKDPLSLHRSCRT